MCGLLSRVGPELVCLERMRAALETMRVRGPDDLTLWTSPCQRVALGHTRLAIVDPSRGQHPVHNESGSVVAVVNGEFYGHPLLRAELESRGHRFHSRSDSEVLVHLYEDYGLEALERLRGEFAFLLWDGDRRRLWAARDRFGVKPLVYARVGQDWCFASKARALFAAGLAPSWDEGCFYHACSTQYAPVDHTLFGGVHQVPPGHHVAFEVDPVPSRLQTRPYWDLPCQEADSSLEVDDFALALDEAVRLRLPAALPCAFQLSGGMDSASVVALACQSLERVEAFTVRFSHPDYDESALALEVADRYGAQLHLVELGPQELMAGLEPAVYHSEGLAINFHLSAKYWLADRVARSGFKVVLTGEGSDEVLLGYPHFRQDLQGGALDPQLLDSNRASAGIMLSSGPTLGLEGLCSELGWVPGFLQAKAALGHRLHQVMRPDFLGAFHQRDCYREMLGHADLAGRSRLDQASYLWCKSALCNYILHTLGDGCEMAHSLEGRVPFLDHRLVELVARLPLEWKIRATAAGTVEKWVLREAMGELLPASILSRRKHPFMAPPLSLDSQLLQQTLAQAARDGLVAFCDRQRLDEQLQRVATLPEPERREWDPVWMWLLTAHYLQRGLGLR